MAYSTSYHALVQRGALSGDDEVLILGASGGVGLAALDIAKAKGARVVVVGSQLKKKRKYVETMGLMMLLFMVQDQKIKKRQKHFRLNLKLKHKRRLRHYL